MSEITEMLNKIESWCYKNKNSGSVKVKPGLTEEEINSIFSNSTFSKKKLFLPEEIFLLYQWGNGGGYRFNLEHSCCAEYYFYPFEYAMQQAEDFNQYLQKHSKKEKIEYIFPIVEEDGAFIWTILDKKKTCFSPLYYNDEFIMNTPNYFSLAAMLESIILKLKIN